MLNTLIGKAKFGGVGGTGGIKYFKFVLLGGDGGSANYNGIGSKGGGGLTEYIISSDTMTSEVILEARTASKGNASAPTGGKGGNGYYLTTLIGLPSGPGPGTWAGGPDSTPLKPSVIAAVGGGGGEGRADNLSYITSNYNPSIPYPNFGPNQGGGGPSGGDGRPGRPTGGGSGASQSSGGGNGDFLIGGPGTPTSPYSGGNHGGGGGGGYYGGGGAPAAPGPNDSHHGGGGGGGSGYVQTSYPNYYSGTTILAGKSKYIDLSFPGTPAGGGGGVFLTSAPLEQINANTVTYTEVFSGSGTKQITLKLDGTFTID